MNKPKTQNPNHKLFINGCFLMLFFTPLIVMLTIATVIGAFDALVLVLSQGNLRLIEYVGVGVLISFCVVYCWISWRMIRRFRLLLQHRHHLSLENQRVADMIDTSAAATRLSEQPITTAAHHGAERHEHPSRDSQPE